MNNLKLFSAILIILVNFLSFAQTKFDIKWYYPNSDIRKIIGNENYLFLLTNYAVIQINKSDFSTTVYDYEYDLSFLTWIKDIVVVGNNLIVAYYDSDYFLKINLLDKNQKKIYKIPQLNDNLSGLSVDHNSNLYLITGTNICKFNLEDSSYYIINFPLIKDMYIKDMAFDDKGNIYFATTVGLLAYVNGRWIDYSSTNFLSSLFSSKNRYLSKPIDIIVKDRKGGFWLIQEKQIIYFKDENVEDVYNLERYSYNNILVLYQNIVSACVDNSNQLWLGTYGSGLIKFNGEKFQVFNNNSSFPKIKYIYCDEYDNSLWLAQNSITKFDGTRFISIPLRLNLFEPSRGNIRFIGIDKNNNKWFGGEKLSVYNNENWKVYDTTATNRSDYNCFAHDQKGNFWIGVNGGILQYKNGHWSDIYDIRINSGYYNITKIYALTVDKNDILWAATDMGLFSFDGKNWTVYSDKEVGTKTNKITALAVDSKNNIWFTNDYGLFVYTRKEWLRYYPTTQNSRFECFTKLAIDKNDVIWLVNCRNELVKFENNYWYVVEDFSKFNMLEKNINTIAVDNNSNVFIGFSYGGLYLYNNQNTIHLNKSYQLLPKSINDIKIDKDGIIWIASSYGLYKLTPQK